MCLGSRAKLWARKASPEICKPDGAHCISSARIERWWTTRWKKNKHRGRGGKVRQMERFAQRKCNICHHEIAQRKSDGEEREMREKESCRDKVEREEKMAGILRLVGEWRWQAASLLSFKCQRLNLSSFVLWPFKMLSHGLWSLRLHCFNWIRW